ncbi:hypothetical protein DFH08DRAFT_725261, partial [Mycena albidolilacea]
LATETPIPMHTSLLTGQMWLSELFGGHPGRFRDQMGIAKYIFYRLSFKLQEFSGLVSMKYVSADEKLEHETNLQHMF